MDCRCLLWTRYFVFYAICVVSSCLVTNFINRWSKCFYIFGFWWLVINTCFVPVNQSLMTLSCAKQTQIEVQPSKRCSPLFANVSRRPLARVVRYGASPPHRLIAGAFLTTGHHSKHSNDIHAYKVRSLSRSGIGWKKACPVSSLSPAVLE